MTALWDELDLDRWTWEVPRDTPGPYVAEHIPKPLITDWVKKWKPIINNAIEKAEKFERYHLHLLSLEDVGVWGAINKLDARLESLKKHMKDYPDVDGKICEDCPYPTTRKNREGACGNCAIGIVKFWLEDHKKILDIQGSSQNRTPTPTVKEEEAEG